MTTPFNTTKGYEVLEFEDAEITRSDADAGSSNKGTLKVSYFPDLSRFILMLNDVNYPLLRRLTITGSDKSDMKSRTYTLPTGKGYYTLKLSKIPNSEAIKNFETVLSNNSQFFYKGDLNPVNKLEMSPKGQSVGFSKNTSDGQSEGGKPKQGLLSKAAQAVSKVLGRSGKNLNLTTGRTIDELMNVNQDFLTVCEFPRETIEESINRSTTETTIGSNAAQTIVREITVTYPKEITDKEEFLLQEINRHRSLQETEREAQQRHRVKEIELLDKERELQDELNNVRAEKTKINITQREEIYGKALADSYITLQQQDEQFIRERQDFINREKTLRGDIEARITEFKNKEKLTQEEQAEFTRREQELTDLNKRLEGERADMDKRHQALKKQAEAREVQIQGEERAIEAEKNQYKKKEEELRAATKQRLAELEKKEKMTEEERAEFIRKQKELEQMNKQAEQERIRLQKTVQEVKAQGERELHTLQEKEKLAESERQKFIIKEKQLEAEARKRLDELKKKEKLTEAEAKELEKRQKELDDIAKRVQAAENKLHQEEQRFAADIKKREAALQEKQRMTENEMSELKAIQERLNKQAQLTEAEKKDLEAMRSKIIKEVEAREAEILRREKLTEGERKELERQEKEAEATLNARLAELRKKEALNEEERLEMRQREEEMTKITKIREFELSHSREKLDEISKHAHNLMVQNEKIVQGHLKVEQDVAELQQELSKPIKVEEQITITKVTTQSDSKVASESYQKSE